MYRDKVLKIKIVFFVDMKSLHFLFLRYSTIVSTMNNTDLLRRNAHKPMGYSVVNSVAWNLRNRKHFRCFYRVEEI